MYTLGGYIAQPSTTDFREQLGIVTATSRPRPHRIAAAAGTARRALVVARPLRCVRVDPTASWPSLRNAGTKPPTVPQPTPNTDTRGGGGWVRTNCHRESSHRWSAVMPGEASPAEGPADRAEAESEPQVGLLCAHPFVVVLDAVGDGHTPPGTHHSGHLGDHRGRVRGVVQDHVRHRGGDGAVAQRLRHRHPGEERRTDQRLVGHPYERRSAVDGQYAATPRPSRSSAAR